MPSPAAAAEEDGQDPFKRLPDDLLISHIFDKISEAKSLCWCSLVSKHFYSLVYLTRKVFLKIPLQVSDDGGLDQFRDFTRRFSLAGKKGVHIVTIPFEFFVHGHGSRPPSSPTPTASENQFLSHPSTKCLWKFNSIKSLQVEFHCCGSRNEQQPVVKWKIDRKSAKYILILAPPTSPGPADPAAAEIGSLMKVQFGCHLDIACLTFSLMESLLPFLPESLQHVIFTDSEKRGRLDLGESELVLMRRTNIPTNTRTTNPKDQGDEESIGFWFAPSLKLPVLSSGSSYMIMITLLKRKRNADQVGNSACNFQRVKQAFEGEEEVLIEDVIEMLRDVDF
ncbi:F-box protein At4g18380-like [Coffea arabica]|uniref:F-box protein At4g18380-like n=1 Tax=Coffea arabica TaxID=13443 RepID=A0ABM4WNX3_COFAR